MVELPDSLYTLPEFITDPDLRTLYEVIIARMREEAAHVRMSTIQQLLIERIAYNYIVLRWREQTMHTAGTIAGFEHSKYAKDYNTFWLSMTAEFNRSVERERDAAKAAQEILAKLGTAINAAFEGLHVDVAGPMKERITSAIESVGL